MNNNINGKEGKLDKELKIFKRKVLNIFKNEEEQIDLNLIDLKEKIKIKNNLLDFIELSSYTRKEIADKIGISTKTLNNIVNNRFSTSLEVAFKLALFFKVRVDDLFYVDIHSHTHSLL